MTKGRVMLLACLGVAVMVLVSMQTRKPDVPIVETATTVTTPVLASGHETVEEVGSVFGAPGRLWDAHKRAAELEKENSHLREANLRYRAVLGDLHALQEQLGLMRRVPFDFVPASIVVSDVDSLLDAVVIDRGERDGVSANMPVLSEGAVIGRVERVRKAASRVLLISDANMAIGVKVERTGVRGLLHGSLSRRSPSLRLELERYLPDDVRVGDKVVTTDESTLFPPGLAVGTVKSLRPPSVREETNAIVRPDADLRNLQRLQVLSSVVRRDALVLAGDDSMDAAPIEGQP